MPRIDTADDGSENPRRTRMVQYALMHNSIQSLTHAASNKLIVVLNPRVDVNLWYVV